MRWQMILRGPGAAILQIPAALCSKQDIRLGREREMVRNRRWPGSRPNHRKCGGMRSARRKNSHGRRMDFGDADASHPGGGREENSIENLRASPGPGQRIIGGGREVGSLRWRRSRKRQTQNWREGGGGGGGGGGWTRRITSGPSICRKCGGGHMRLKFLKKSRGRKKTGHRKVSHVKACRMEAGATNRARVLNGRVEHAVPSGCVAGRMVTMYRNNARIAGRRIFWGDRSNHLYWASTDQ